MRSRTLRTAVNSLTALALTAGALTACGSDEPGDDAAVRVVSGFYPLQFVAERIGTPHTSVRNLSAPGAEPHDLELSPAQIDQVANADLVLYLLGFQPELDKAVAQNNADRALDVATITPLIEGSQHQQHEGEEEAEEDNRLDPHVWLDPRRLATISDAVAARHAELDPEHAADYLAKAAELRAALVRLDEEYQTGLQTCERREIVTSHAAFGYLSDRYGLEQVSLSGLTPETEPTPQRLAQVAAEAREHEATTIFFETLVSPKVAETLASQIGAKTAVLDPLEGPPSGEGSDYFSAMRANLETLRAALGCA